MNGNSNQPYVSVVIPTKNPGKLFRQVLHAVLEQDTSWTYEVIVVDSGSTDGTVEFVQNTPSVCLLEIPPADFGHGKTRNIAVALAKGTYVAMITHDALPASKQWLAALVTTAEQDQRIAGVFGRHLAYPDASPFTKYELELHFASFERQPIVRLDDRYRYEADEGYRQFLYFFSDNNALLRREVWEHYPYPEVDFAEDQAWARQIIEAGYLKAYSRDAAVYHSHEYGLIERFQRSFDESYALTRLFNYRGGTGFLHALRSWVGLGRRDLSYVIKNGLVKAKFHLLVRTPLDNLMRVAGTYLGVRGDRLPVSLRRHLSRDYRLKAANNTRG